MIRPVLLATAIAALPVAGQAGEYLTYEVGGAAYEGYVAMPEGESRGTVLIVHDWNGMTDYEEQRADMLTEAGFTAFAIDVYGAETDPQGVNEYQALSGALYRDRSEFRARLLGSVAAVTDIPGAPENIVMMGYCFGGAAVLEAARAGVDLNGFVSFHGGLSTPEGQDWSEANGAPVQFFHGSNDPVSDLVDLAQLMDELVAADIPHGAEIYGGARHSFTVFSSRDCLEDADADSWAGLLDFLDKTL